MGVVIKSFFVLSSFCWLCS
jgi:hypothetical protein